VQGKDAGGEVGDGFRSLEVAGPSFHSLDSPRAPLTHTDTCRTSSMSETTSNARSGLAKSTRSSLSPSFRLLTTF
jgi:hypothetical protein